MSTFAAQVIQAILLLLAGGGGIEIVRFILSRFDHGEDLEAKLRGELRSDNLELRNRVDRLTDEMVELRESNFKLMEELTVTRAQLRTLQATLDKRQPPKPK